MTDLISRQDAISFVALKLTNRWNVDFNDGVRAAIEALTNMPSADTDVAKEYLGRRILAEFEKP